MVAGHGQHGDVSLCQSFHACLEIAVGDKEVTAALDHVAGQEHSVHAPVDRLTDGTLPGCFGAQVRPAANQGLGQSRRQAAKMNVADGEQVDHAFSSDILTANVVTTQMFDDFRAGLVPGNIMDSAKTDKHGFSRTCRNWPGAPLGRTAAAVVLLLALSGCAATLQPPSALDEPAPVYVLDHGRHNSLVLVVAPERVMRYAFGEWRWYVDGETGPLRSLDALIRPTPAALGRMHLTGPPEPDCWVDQVGSVIRQVLVFRAEAEQVRLLSERLDAAFDRSEARPYFSQVLNLELIVDERAYTLRFNSNHQVVAWLEELGFTVTGSPALGWLRPDQAERSVNADSSRCSAFIHSDSSAS